MKKKKIGFDITYVIEDEPSGIRKSAEEKIQSILDITDEYEICLFVDNDLRKIYEKNFPTCKIIATKTYFKHVKYLVDICKTTVNIKFRKNIMKKEKCDLLIHPYSSNTKNTPLLGENTEISSILDVIPMDLILDRTSKEYNDIKKEYLKLINSNKYILTISNFTKQRILNLEPNFNGKIFVIYEVIEKPQKTNKKVSDIIGTEQKYILSINSFLSHKNQLTLIKAFEKIINKIPHQLILVGRTDLGSPYSKYKEIIQYINDNKLENRIKILSCISDEDRNSLLYNTYLFISTSTQEGFGRTPVEAMLCEVPVITTRETSLPEATMEMANYYKNAYDENELADKICEVLKNPPSKNNLKEIANKLEIEYSRKNIANQYIEMIKEVIKENGNSI